MHITQLLSPVSSILGYKHDEKMYQLHKNPYKQLPIIYAAQIEKETELLTAYQIKQERQNQHEKKNVSISCKFFFRFY